jgi:outer membrane protein assembly factor BamB
VTRSDQMLRVTSLFRWPIITGRPYSRWGGVLTMAVLVTLVLTGCGRQVPSYWPEVSLDTTSGTLYVTATNGQVFALRPDDGTVLWAYPLIQQQSGGILGGCSAATVSDGPFHAPPVATDEFVFLGSAGEQQRSLFAKGENRGGMRVLSKSGVLQWAFTGTVERAVAAPSLSETTAYLPSSDHQVYAIDLATHESRWVFSTGNWVWATPLPLDGRVYIASMDHALYAVDEQTGTEIWRFTDSQSALPAAPAFSAGVLYVGSLGGHIYAIDPQSGALRWEQTVSGGIWATPLVQEGVLYFGTLGGKVYALDALEGAVIWERGVEGETRGTPAYVDGKIYIGSETGQLHAFDAQSGDPAMSPLGTQTKQSSIYTSPVFDGKYLYVASTDGQVYALDLQKQQVVWQVNPTTASN